MYNLLINLSTNATLLTKGMTNILRGSNRQRKWNKRLISRLWNLAFSVTSTNASTHSECVSLSVLFPRNLIPLSLLTWNHLYFWRPNSKLVGKASFRISVSTTIKKLQPSFPGDKSETLRLKFPNRLEWFTKLQNFLLRNDSLMHV